jgi:iron complex transport system ATP-binding protein
MRPTSMGGMASTVLQFQHVSVIRDGNTILDDIDWNVGSDERWVILGPNGAGKTTLLQIAAAAMHPTKGSAEVLQESLGKVDVFELRPMIGFASTAMARRIPKNETVLDAVLTAAYSVTGRWNEEYETIDDRRAQRVLRSGASRTSLDAASAASPTASRSACRSPARS